MEIFSLKIDANNTNMDFFGRRKQERKVWYFDLTRHPLNWLGLVCQLQRGGRTSELARSLSCDRSLKITKAQAILTSKSDTIL